HMRRGDVLVRQLEGRRQVGRALGGTQVVILLELLGQGLVLGPLGHIGLVVVGTVLFLGGVAQVADDLVVGGHGLLAPVHPLVQRVPLGLGLEDRGAAVIQVALVVVLAALLAHGVKDGLLLGADLLGGLLV